MDREMVEWRLSQANEHVFLGRKRVAEQRVIVAELEATGHDSSVARTLLSTFEDLLKTHESDRARIAQQLAALE